MRRCRRQGPTARAGESAEAESKTAAGNAPAAVANLELQSKYEGLRLLGRRTREHQRLQAGIEAALIAGDSVLVQHTLLDALVQR